MDVLRFFDKTNPGPSWAAWRAFVAALYGLPMTSEELACFQRHTGRTTPRAGGYPEAVCIVGVQSGKSATLGSLAAFEAIGAESGTSTLLVAQDTRSSVRTLFKYARQPFDQVPALKKLVSSVTADGLELKSGASIVAYPCRPAAARGLRCAFVGIDELAFFTTSDGRATDTEMLRMARGRVATTQGRVVVISSPYAASGALYDLHRKNYGQEASPVLVWQASAPEMNPTLPADYLTRMEADDPEAYQSEVLGMFRAGLSLLFDPETLQACVDEGVHEYAPRPDRNYIAGADAASGSGSDRFAVAVAHSEGKGRVVLDAVRSWSPPFSAEAVVAEARAFLASYRITSVRADAYAGGLQDELWKRHGLKREDAPGNKSEVLLRLLPLVNAGSASLIDDRDLLRELRGLERKTSTTGRDRVDHRRGAHDDRAAAAANALVSAVVKSGLKTTWVATGDFSWEARRTGIDEQGRTFDARGNPYNGVFWDSVYYDSKGRPQNLPQRWVDGVEVPFSREEAEHLMTHMPPAPKQRVKLRGIWG